MTSIENRKQKWFVIWLSIKNKQHIYDEREKKKKKRIKQRNELIKLLIDKLASQVKSTNRWLNNLIT